MALCYYVDIDNTIAQTDGSNYHESIPYPHKIAKINELYDRGNKIVYYTARGGSSKRDWTELTRRQLNMWGCKYHELRTDKPSYDVLICDKTIHPNEFFN